MDAVAPSVAVATPKKAKAVKTKAPKKVATHPSYQEMIKKAVETLKERNGSSRQAIQKYIQATFKTCDDKVSQAHLKLALKRGVETGSLKRVKGTGASGSFRLAQIVKPVVKKVVKKPAVKKVVKKPLKPAAKKAAKPKTVKAKAPSKPKKAVAEKKASKPKVAKKPKTPKKAVKPVAKKAATPKAKKAAAPKAKKPAAKKAPVSAK